MTCDDIVTLPASELAAGMTIQLPDSRTWVTVSAAEPVSCQPDWWQVSLSTVEHPAAGFKCSAHHPIKVIA